MAIKRKDTTVKVARAHRAVRNVKFVQHETKGATGIYDDALKAGMPIAEKQIADPYSAILNVGLWQASGHNPIEPSFNFYTLARLVQNSNVLRQCIESYVTNIDKTGDMLEYVGPEGQENGVEQEAEKNLLESFLAFCSPSLSLQEIRERVRTDLESTGNAFLEISRNGKGQIILFDHIPATTMRRTRREEAATPVLVEVPDPSTPGALIRKVAMRNFCRYVQLSNTTAGTFKRVYFKEFGDPRSIDPASGDINDALPVEQQATEVLMLSLYVPGNIYGLPRWIGQLPSILGSRESEMVNLNFFRENAIPAMAVLISGGALTKESFDLIDQYINSLRGQKAMQRILVLEASGDDVSGSTDHSVAAPKIDMKPMISERQQDGLFKEYDTANQEKIRSAFRLPPIYLGRAQDYTRASAIASMQTAEDQIFGPERRSFDSLMNNQVLKTYRPKYWRYKSLPIPLSDPDSLASMIDKFNASGAMTPNIVIKIANRILSADIEPITEDWGDYPFSILLEYVKQGMEIKGLSKFIVDVKSLSSNKPAPTPAPNAAVPQQPGAAASALKAKPVKPVNGKAKAKKSDEGLPFAELRDTIRQELSTVALDFEDAIVAAVQVPAH